MQPIHNSLAMDSARELDKFGKMYVRDNRISKACISDYYGKEIPGYRELKLDPDKLYRLFRDPVEIEKAVNSFKGIPVLLGHPNDDNTSPLADLAVGSVMDDVRFEFPYLVASIAVWDQGAQAGIETGIQKELSPSYSYTPDVTPGVFEGEPYDIVMRDLHAYHLAIVPDGRTGPDVLVNDAKPEELKMDKQESKANDDVLAGLRERLPNASDEDIKTISDYIAERSSKANDSEDKDGKKADDEEDKDDKDDKDDKKADDEDEDKPEKKANDAKFITANDAAVIAKQAADKARQDERNHQIELRRAERECSALIGEVACDSAEEVYRMALSQQGIDTNGIHPSALPKLVEVLKSRPTVNQTVAMDSNSISRVDSFFGGK
jgi:uncharacterized protein